MIRNFTGISDKRIAPLAVKLLAEDRGQVLIITPSTVRAKRIATDLSFFARCEGLEGCGVSVLPDVDPAAVKFEAKSSEELYARLGVMAEAAKGVDGFVVAPVLGALKRLPPPEVFCSGVLRLSAGGRAERSDIIASLSSMGYERSAPAELPGQFAVRGDIIDVFCPGNAEPVRIELFDDEIDSIRSFDPLTQRSTANLDGIEIWPCKLLIAGEEAVRRAKKGLAGAYKNDPETLGYLNECIDNGLNSQYLENFISYYYPDDFAHIWEYMPALKLIIVDDPARVCEAMDLFNEEAGAGEVPVDTDDFALINSLNVLYCTPFAQQIRFVDALDELRHIETRQAPVFGGHMDVLESEIRRFAAAGYRVVIACSTEDRLMNLKDFFSRCGLERSVELRTGILTQGTEFPEQKLLSLAEHDIFPAVREKRRRRKGRDRAIKAFTDIRKGDYVVHEAHGVGRFIGVEKLEIQGSVRDYLKISYAGNDMLYVPVDQMESVQKYVGAEGVTPKITGLSGGEWQKTKSKAKEAIREMAEEFIKLAAERAKEPGYRFGPDSSWQKEFEDSFPYEETDDQLRCTEEIKRDMQSDKAMDRLLCGDVGYGKTEVAARAVFKCLEEGKQAAVLVPTTILANQHFRTFTERLSGYPFNIEMLSRFRSQKQQDETVRKLLTGDVDLVIGTHRLLSQDVKFKDLGLLVIDEEQRFGVEHKEAIKRLKSNVDVLTLSATPIPRTLHMSLIGVRDMSVIEEPPEDRYPVQTYVTEQDDRLIADVIRRELGRGGQVYLVYNRVSGINTVARRIRAMIPEARVAVGHGQMPEHQLEDIMMDFVNHDYDVLVATTIIESGLDIPNVNTLIVLDADRFGLAQLYQLRGRVGRSNRMAYAYLVYKKDKVLSETAEKRLRAIREFTEFGSGFRIAMRDLELRGAGNILGVEQSGHMLSIGYELYCKLVDEAVRELTGGEGAEEKPLSADTSVELSIPAYLPEEYVADEITRLDLYKRISSISDSRERMDMTDELMDRFGDLPQQADNLLDIAMIRNMASRCGASQVVLQQAKLVFIFEERNILTPQHFAELLDRFGSRLTIYAGSQPRLSLAVSRKVKPQTDALTLLNTLLNAGK
ncbi:MAG: transcription-repair coupling factor [Firmicutes bacterium]|nr:transcription-repair coupling factor [Bacillota bacterium]